MITTPTIQEARDWGDTLFQVWRTEPEDKQATASSFEYLEGAMAQAGIHPVAYHVRCTEHLCRSRLRFSTITELHQMANVKVPEGTDLANTFPQTINDELVDLSIYWGRNGASIQNMLHGHLDAGSSGGPGR